MVQLVVTPDFWVSRIYPEGLIERWLVPDGTEVQADQPVAELRIEGDLITLKAPAAGKLLIDSRGNGPIEPGSVIGHISAISRI
jgi:pyruvate/2-oxoglutarate dehydrogenase complex dihydrolipoamide acyltransferase (E2) component